MSKVNVKTGKVFENENGRIVFDSRKLRIRLFRFHPESRKLNIICVDDGERVFKLSDYKRDYGDVIEISPNGCKNMRATAKRLAKLINRDVFFKKYTSIVMIGISAANLYMLDTLQFIKVQKAIMISTIQVPFDDDSEWKCDFLSERQYMEYMKFFTFLKEEDFEALKEIKFATMREHRIISFIVKEQKPVLFRGRKLIRKRKDEVYWASDTLKQVTIYDHDPLCRAFDYFRS